LMVTALVPALLFPASLAIGERSSLLGLPVPPGWRIPTAAELGYRPANAVVSGDFNGDGKQDKAMLLVSSDGSRGALYVFLAQQHGFKAYDLASFRGEMMKRMSIRPIAAGRYATLCAQGYWPCARGESRSVTIPYDAIDLAFEEGSDSYEYWDPKTRSFKEVDMSD
jgi:hypothetical protein